VPRRNREQEEDDFTLVDTKAMPRPMGFRKGKGKGKGFFNQWQPWGKGAQEPRDPRTGKPYPPGFDLGKMGIKGKAPKGKGKGKGNAGGKNRGGKASFRDWSVPVNPEWAVKDEIVLPGLAKLSLDAKKVQREDLLWCGTLREYDKAFDRITPKLEKTLHKLDDVSFYNVTAREDPMVSHLMQQEAANYDVAVTDLVLATIMAAARSLYSWDIVVTKIDDKLLLDKRDRSHIDILTVNETAPDPPQNDDKDSINAPAKLGDEASAINQYFSQQVLNMKGSAVDMEQPNPFEDEGRTACGAYRYQKFTLPGNERSPNEHEQRPINILCRCDVDCLIPDQETKVYGSIKAMNEYNPKGNTGWRNCLESQRGAVLATELKNNSFKLARWTCQSLIAGVDVMKLGYVTRKSNLDPWRHIILNVQTHKTSDFAQQIGLTQQNAWGVVRHIIDMFMQPGYPNGKYLLLKDPTKSVMRAYEIPWETFEDDEEDEDDMEGGEFVDDEEVKGKGPDAGKQ
jgi:translation initiation factor 3 subunit D